MSDVDILDRVKQSGAWVHMTTPLWAHRGATLNNAGAGDVQDWREGASWLPSRWR